MDSKLQHILPVSLRRDLQKIGSDISTARKKRGLTVAMMAERLGVAKTTYLRLEKGDPSVSLGAFAMALFVLGFADALADLVDPSRDDQGLLLDTARLPKRVRTRKEPRGL